MRITETFWEDEDDYRASYKLELDTKTTKIQVSFNDGEPEDNGLCRNFSGVYSIRRLIEAAHEAGLRNEGIEFISIDESEE